MKFDPSGRYGGKGKKKAESHFSQRCGNSCSRTVYILESGGKDFDKISSSLIATLSSDTVGIVDLAAGSGGGTLGILTSIENLRYSREIPCTPLTIHIHAADFSKDSLSLYKKMIDEISNNLSSVGIEVHFHEYSWDATDVVQASKLCDKILSDTAIKEYIVFVSVLSGVKPDGLKPMVRSFQHILERFADRCMSSLWIEPGDSSVRFLNKVVNWIYSTCTWLSPLPIKKKLLEAEYIWIHRIQEKELPGKLSCVKYDRKNLI